MDRDYTPIALARACVSVALADFDPAARSSLSVLEPSSGGGSFVSALAEHGITPATCDLDPGARRCADHFEGDFCTYPSGRRFDLIIGNPPFSEALEHADKALELLAPSGLLALILPLAFGTHKADWWESHRPGRVLMVTPRPEFRVEQADMREVALHMWWRDELEIGMARLSHLRWEKPPRAVARAQRAEQCGQLPIVQTVDPRQTSIYDVLGESCDS